MAGGAGGGAGPDRGVAVRVVAWVLRRASYVVRRTQDALPSTLSLKLPYQLRDRAGAAQRGAGEGGGGGFGAAVGAEAFPDFGRVGGRGAADHPLAVGEEDGHAEDRAARGDVVDEGDRELAGGHLGGGAGGAEGAAAEPLGANLDDEEVLGGVAALELHLPHLAALELERRARGGLSGRRGGGAGSGVAVAFHGHAGGKAENECAEEEWNSAHVLITT
ncbi:MAG: hypothetical protein C4308_14695 [Chitinophagaceae bacterium]